MFRVLLILFAYLSLLFSQDTPLEKSNFTRLTSYEELKKYVAEIDKNSRLIKKEVLTTTNEGREIYILYFSKGDFGKNKNKLKILFFAQQHGNEQSGKEGVLFLIKELLKKENHYLFDRIDFALIPQMNPDGSEKNQRRNSNGVDLNRNHLILTENETKALHKLFNKYNFEVTLDVHEYFPYSNDWKEFDYYKNADEQLGLLTNLNINEKLRSYQKKKVLPFIENYLKAKNYTFCEYVVGGPPDKERLRHSTVDINDGRQSFGILNTLSFILEGKNGRDFYLDNIERRAKGQCETMLGLLKFCYQNQKEIKKLVEAARKDILKKDSVIVRSDHFPDGQSFKLPVKLVGEEKDTIISISNYHPVIESLLKIKIPFAYLIPKNDELLVEFIQDHNLRYSEIIPDDKVISRYEVINIDSILIEGEYLVDIQIQEQRVNKEELGQEYILIPTDQLKKNLIVLALEPQSMSGLVQYEKFRYLYNCKNYPILKIE
ncbi:MAG: M14 family zinc carboxypeptidase [Ignavibacteria bacterium]|nr:hypothetical protein [Ignavibacteria bacterium]